MTLLQRCTRLAASALVVCFVWFATLTAVAAAPCGNGVLDAGEECDDGNNERGDCCDIDCQLENINKGCGDDGNECTRHLCDDAGICNLVNVEDLGPHPTSCDDGDTCTFQGECIGGACVSRGTLRPLERARVEAKLGVGAEDAPLRLRARFKGGMSFTTPRNAGFTLRFLDGVGSVLHESFIGPSSWREVSRSARRFIYMATGTPAPEAGGAHSMRVVVRRGQTGRPHGDRISVVADFGTFDLATLAGHSEIGLEVTVGTAPEGICATATTLACTSSARRMICK